MPRLQKELHWKNDKTLKLKPELNVQESSQMFSLLLNKGNLS
jgi:hypothetical protein